VAQAVGPEFKPQYHKTHPHTYIYEHSLFYFIPHWKFFILYLAYKTWDFCRIPVVHACNPSYLGGKDQEDHSSRPA
jgi:hypothetical protein